MWHIWGRTGMPIEFRWGTLKERDCLKELSVDVRIQVVSKWILEKYEGRACTGPPAQDGDVGRAAVSRVMMVHWCCAGSVQRSGADVTTTVFLYLLYTTATCFGHIYYPSAGSYMFRLCVQHKWQLSRTDRPHNIQLWGKNCVLIAVNKLQSLQVLNAMFRMQTSVVLSCFNYFNRNGYSVVWVLRVSEHRDWVHCLCSATMSAIQCFVVIGADRVVVHYAVQSADISTENWVKMSWY